MDRFILDAGLLLGEIDDPHVLIGHPGQESLLNRGNPKIFDHGKVLEWVIRTFAGIVAVLSSSNFDHFFGRFIDILN